MPYIADLERAPAVVSPESGGELNFAISRIVNLYLETHGLKYRTLNDILGALEGAKLEFYRRIVVPYEDKKLAENGDVYTTHV